MYDYLVIILSKKFSLPLEIINMIIFNFEGLKHPIINIFKNNSIHTFIKKVILFIIMIGNPYYHFGI